MAHPPVRYRAAPHMTSGSKLLRAFFSISGLLGAMFCFQTSRWHLLPVFVLVAAAPFIPRVARKVSARMLFDLCALRVLDEKVRLGGVARVLLSLEPKRPVKLNGATLSFWTEEKAIYDAGTSSRTYREELHRSSTPLDLPPVLEGSFEREILVSIPRDIPPTFRGKNNFLHSFCHVYLDIPGVPDVEIEQEIRVAPELADG